VSWKEDPNATYVNAKGKVFTRTQKSTAMAETKDARTLSSGTPQEEAYASYANTMKGMANTARKEAANAGRIQYSSSAKKTYQKEEASLVAQLNVALKNAPREQAAQIVANSEVSAKKKAYPNMKNDELKKVSQQALTKARTSVGAKRTSINISDREWEAIQAGAISENVLLKILKNTNIDKVRQLATPKSTSTLTDVKKKKIETMIASGYSNSEIAKALGVSTSVVSNYKQESNLN
jgi:DNA-binding CsgD family transcriptional regulator